MAKFKLGLFENRTVKLEAIKNHVFIDLHKKTALESAQKGIILLKNNGILPLANTSNNKRILVTGPNANNQTTLGDWHAEQPNENVITIFEGIQDLGTEKGYEVSFFDSGENIRKIKDTKINAVAALAHEVDYVIVVVGDNSMRYRWKNKTAGENMARSALDLPGKQLELVKAIENTGTPVIIVLVNGRPISEPWLQNNVPAIIESWEPGLFGGEAVADILFGDVNPSGKLPLTVARSVGQLRMIYNHKPSAYFHKYALEKKKPLYPFGFGLSYTKYKYSKPRLSSNELKKGKPVTISFEIENYGDMDGEEIVQLYIRDNVSSATRPVKELKGYKRVFLVKGTSKTVSFEIDESMLAFYDINMDYCVEPGDFSIMVGSSSADIDLKSVNLTVNNRIKIKD
jgi:beta-glucosidase